MENENKNSKKNIVYVAVLVLVVLAAVGSYFVFGGNGNKVSNKVVNIATVNGTVISQTTYDTQLASAIASYKTQGVDVTASTTLSQIKTQILNNLIDSELLIQGARVVGIKTSDADTEKQFQAILTQAGGAEGLKTALTKNNITEAELRKNISNQLTIQAYLLANIDTKSIAVTDAEITKVYTDYSKAQKTASSTIKVPALKDLSPQIKQQLVSNKEQALIANFVAALRAKAKIETKL